eukprot:Lithocolla_globosa_v1_NODE_1232_length_2753_cov_6.257969.p2 type:complete len:123 gc:universal NODE_1232_length_2753_cov_6.257969:1472-1840(+)
MGPHIRQYGFGGQKDPAGHREQRPKLEHRFAVRLWVVACQFHKLKISLVPQPVRFQRTPHDFRDHCRIGHTRVVVRRLHPDWQLVEASICEVALPVSHSGFSQLAALIFGCCVQQREDQSCL